MSTGAFTYRPYLDGVRALAICLVLAAHSLPDANGGVIGVNIFFALSGYLITGLLLGELDRRGRVLLGNFYLRRALRLLPPLLLVLVLVAALPNVYLTVRDGASIPRPESIPAALFYVGNIVQALGQPFGYLAHTWSLGVEEQFYLFWPLAVLWLATTGRLRRWLPALIVAFVLIRAGMAIAHVPGVEDWLPAQADQLLIGALLAVWTRDGGGVRWARHWTVGWGALGVLAAVALGWSTTHHAEGDPSSVYGGLTVVGLAATALIAHLIASGGALRALFSLAPVVALGRVSYGVYLFHFPIFQFVQHQRWSRPPELLVEYAATAVAVLASWFLVERPAGRLKDRLRRRESVPARVSR